MIDGDISDEEPGITDVDEVNHIYDKPLLIIPGERMEISNFNSMIQHYIYIYIIAF